VFGGLIMDYQEKECFLITIIIALLVIMIVSGVVAFSPKVVSVESAEVEAIITEVDKDPRRLIGKVYRPADYDIYFEYQGIKGEKDISSVTYNKYKDKVGQTIKCCLITRTYSDGSTKITLEMIEE
jgi:hypothetical protein